MLGGFKRGKRYCVTAAWHGVLIMVLYLCNSMLVPPRDLQVAGINLVTKKVMHPFVRKDEAQPIHAGLGGSIDFAQDLDECQPGTKVYPELHKIELVSKLIN